MSFEPASHGALADEQPVLPKKIDDGTDPFAFAAELPNDFRVIIQLRTRRSRRNSSGFFQDGFELVHRGFTKNSGFRGNCRDKTRDEGRQGWDSPERRGTADATSSDKAR